MKSYPHQIASSQLDSAAWQPKLAVIPSGGRRFDVVGGQRSLRIQTGNPHRRRLFRHIIATALLAVVTVFLWLSLIGFAPGADAHPAAHTDPAEQSTSATTLP
jgi:predicted secreted protein